jgi:hypothetical protein
MRTLFAQTLVCLLAVAQLFSPRVAEADVVGPAPTSCPAGTDGRSCHGGPYCGPSLCTMDSECRSGSTCVERTLCITRIGCAGLLPPDADPADFEADQVEGGRCPDDCPGECRTLRVCVAAGSGGGSGGCCTTAPGRATPWLGAAGLLAGIAALVAARARRRRRVSAASR